MIFKESSIKCLVLPKKQFIRHLTTVMAHKVLPKLSVGHFTYCLHLLKLQGFNWVVAMVEL